MADEPKVLVWKYQPCIKCGGDASVCEECHDEVENTLNDKIVDLETEIDDKDKEIENLTDLLKDIKNLADV